MNWQNNLVCGNLKIESIPNDEWLGTIPSNKEVMKRNWKTEFTMFTGSSVVDSCKNPFTDSNSCYLNIITWPIFQIRQSPGLWASIHFDNVPRTFSQCNVTHSIIYCTAIIAIYLLILYQVMSDNTIRVFWGRWLPVQL